MLRARYLMFVFLYCDVQRFDKFTANRGKCWVVCIFRGHKLPLLKSFLLLESLGDLALISSNKACKLYQDCDFIGTDIKRLSLTLLVTLPVFQSSFLTLFEQHINRAQTTVMTLGGMEGHNVV